MKNERESATLASLTHMSEKMTDLIQSARKKDHLSGGRLLGFLLAHALSCWSCCSNRTKTELINFMYEYGRVVEMNKRRRGLGIE